MPGTAPRRRRGRILLSLLGLLFLVGVVPLLFTSWNLAAKSQDSLEYNQKALQLAKARGLSQQIAIYTESLHRQVLAIARTLEVDVGHTPFAGRVKSIKEQHALERYLGDQSRFIYVSVVDASGSGAQSGVQLQELQIQQGLQEGFYRGLQGTPMIAHPLLSTSLAEPVLIFAEPVKGAGKVEGVVLAVGSLLPIWQMTQQIGERLFDVYVVDSRCKLIAHSNPQETLGTDVSTIEIVRLFLESKG